MVSPNASMNDLCRY